MLFDEKNKLNNHVSMGLCVDPSDCNQRISGLTVGPFRGYPLMQSSHGGN